MKFEHVVDRLSKYIEKNVMPTMNNLQKIGILTFIGMIKHNPQAYKQKIMDDPLFKWLIVENDQGEIEIEGLICGLRDAVNKEGMAILDTKMFGKMTFRPSDIEELKRYLTE